MTNIILPCGRVSIIDDEDINLISGLRLFSEVRGRTRYVRLRRPGQRGGGIYLHNLIMGGRADHRDGDGLNNQRENLRCCTQAQNGLNRAAKIGKTFKGVYYDKRRGYFYAQIALNGVTKTICRLSSEVDAARAYDRMALDLHGEWARLNSPAEPVDGRQGALL